jgi:UDPglucose--hexose-1-phosphate uridylyltransferase
VSDLMNNDEVIMTTLPVDLRIGLLIEALIQFGIYNEMMEDLDTPLVRNDLMSLMGIGEPFEFGKEYEGADTDTDTDANTGKNADTCKNADTNTNADTDTKADTKADTGKNANADVNTGVIIVQLEELKATIDYSTPTTLLDKLLDLAVTKGFIEDNTTERDLFDAKIMGNLMPRQSELNHMYQKIKDEKGSEAGTDFFYKLSKDSNYIRMDRINKNVYWEASTEYGNLEITINLSKPEKDPQEIAKALSLPQASYPKCLLCLENVGYEGRLNHPGRANHRVLPLTLDKEAWYLQYSPYVYYNEHSIIFKGQHEPMKIQRSTFVRMLDFVEEMPHYFVGSNADLPIVGGSILSHDHFQGGHHQFPMEVAPTIIEGKDKNYPKVKVGIVKWPLSVIRLSSDVKEDLVDLSDEILAAWREYTDEAVGIYAYSEIDGEKVPHNTITPISRKNNKGLFELDLVLRNNRQSDEHPDGIFHPHAHLHHIKKENIGLIEVMGLAVLPARLKEELGIIEDILSGRVSIKDVDESMNQHLPWIRTLIDALGTNLDRQKASELVRVEVGHKFADVLACAGVYKLDEQGIQGFKRFLDSLGIN